MHVCMYVSMHIYIYMACVYIQSEIGTIVFPTIIPIKDC